MNMEQKPALENLINSTADMVMKDLEALPEEAFAKKFDGKARTVADIVYELVVVNDFLCKKYLGDEPIEFEFNGWLTAPDDFQAKDVVVAGMKESIEKVKSALSEATEDVLAKVNETPQGPKTTGEQLQFIGVHMAYHSGQFNYIQTLLGDDGWHW
jgi:uncharacterized damage-inducible protein DinB